MRSRLLAGAFVVLLVAVIVVAGQFGSRAGRETPTGGRTTSSSKPTPTPSASASAAPCGFDDGFDAATVDTAWEKVQPGGGFVVAAGEVELAAKNGSDIYVDKLLAPMLLRRPGGDFTIETDVTADPRQYYQGAGLLLWGGSQHYVRLERGFGDVGAVIFEYRDGGRHIKVRPPHSWSPAIIRTEETHVQLRLVKNKTSVTASWRPSGVGDWRDIGTITVALPDNVKAGVSVLNRAQGEAKPTTFTASFDYVRGTCGTAPPG